MSVATERIADGAPELTGPFWQWRTRFERGHHPTLWEAFLAGSGARERILRREREPLYTALERYGLKGLDLTGREARVVAALARSTNATLTREEIVREVWGVPLDLADLDSRFHLLRVVVALVRPKLGTRGICLGTLPSWGYRLHVVGQSEVCTRSLVGRGRGFVALCLRGDS